MCLLYRGSFPRIFTITGLTTDIVPFTGSSLYRGSSNRGSAVYIF